MLLSCMKFSLQNIWSVLSYVFLELSPFSKNKKSITKQLKLDIGNVDYIQVNILCRTDKGNEIQGVPFKKYNVDRLQFFVSPCQFENNFKTWLSTYTALLLRKLKIRNRLGVIDRGV